MRNTVIKRITEIAKTKDDLFLITGDAGFGVLDEYCKSYPKRFLNLGIAEQNMISFASGLAMVGYKVVVYNIIPFLLYRCYEQVRNDICYQNLPVILIGIGSGLTYAPQGVTHYSVEDIQIALSLPNLQVMSPSDPFEAEACIEYAIKSSYPSYIRIAKSGEPKIHPGKLDNICDPIVVHYGKRVAVLMHGSVSIEVAEAVKDMKNSPMIISIPMLAPLNFNKLTELLKDIETVLTIEEHFVYGGLGTILADWISVNRLPYKLVKLGIKNEFIHHIKNTKGMREHYRIDSLSIREILQGLLL